MCEIFPEVDKCCFCVSIRIAMVMIAILAIMTGVMGLSAIEKESKASYDNLKNITELEHVVAGPEPFLNKSMNVMRHVNQIVPTGMAIMFVVFMICGSVLLWGNFSDQEGFVQIFVWLTFLNVFFGFIMVLTTAFECITSTETCIMKHMDWLSSASALVMAFFYLCLWIYFITVANTYVLNVWR